MREAHPCALEQLERDSEKALKEKTSDIRVQELDIEKQREQIATLLSEKRVRNDKKSFAASSGGPSYM